MTPLMLVLQSCDLKSLDSRLDLDSSPKFEELRLDLDFDNNDSRLDLDLSPVTQQIFVFQKNKTEFCSI